MQWFYYDSETQAIVLRDAQVIDIVDFTNEEKSMKY